MNGFRVGGLWALGLVWLGVGCAYAVEGGEKPEEAETVVIPLDQIAGLGRKGLYALEPDLHIYRDTPENIEKYSDPKVLEEALRKAKQHSLVIPIERAMSALPIGKEVKPHAGFAVRGRDRAALPGVHRVLVLGEKPDDSFPLNTEVSLVFFTPLTGIICGLDRVVRKGNMFEIHYVLLHNRLTVARSKLVFIPCGKLPASEYQVQMIRSKSKEMELNRRDIPPDFPTVEAGIEDHIVCQSFSFKISSDSTKGSNAETHNHHLD